MLKRDHYPLDYSRSNQPTPNVMFTPVLGTGHTVRVDHENYRADGSVMGAYSSEHTVVGRLDIGDDFRWLRKQDSELLADITANDLKHVKSFEDLAIVLDCKNQGIDPSSLNPFANDRVDSMGDLGIVTTEIYHASIARNLLSCNDVISFKKSQQFIDLSQQL